MQTEEWRDISGYHDKYQVSSLGRVRSLINSKCNYRSTPLVLKPGKNNRGYSVVALRNDFKLKSFLVSRLNHIDCKTSNNSVDNLEWVSPKENMEHAVLNKLTARGEKAGASKLTEDDVLAIRTLFNQTAQTKTAAFFGVSQMAICNILKRKTWTHI